MALAETGGKFGRNAIATRRQRRRRTRSFVRGPRLVPIVSGRNNGNAPDGSGIKRRGNQQPTAPTKTLPATVRIFPYGVSRSRLDRAIAENRVPAYVARDISDADAVLALKATLQARTRQDAGSGPAKIAGLRRPQQYLRANRQQRPRNLRHERHSRKRKRK